MEPITLILLVLAVFLVAWMIGYEMGKTKAKGENRKGYEKGVADYLLNETTKGIGSKANSNLEGALEKARAALNKKLS
ncbi:MAG TPA: hypothetical protein PLM98_04685 [Thiolinea sp.]|nr:hypothetical protein [Thiolinea sp.]